MFLFYYLDAIFWTSLLCEALPNIQQISLLNYLHVHLRRQILVLRRWKTLSQESTKIEWSELYIRMCACDASTLRQSFTHRIEVFGSSFLSSIFHAFYCTWPFLDNHLKILVQLSCYELLIEQEDNDIMASRKKKKKKTLEEHF